MKRRSISSIPSGGCWAGTGLTAYWAPLRKADVYNQSVADTAHRELSCGMSDLTFPDCSWKLPFAGAVCIRCGKKMSGARHRRALEHLNFMALVAIGVLVGCGLWVLLGI